MRYQGGVRTHGWSDKGGQPGLALARNQEHGCIYVRVTEQDVLNLAGLDAKAMELDLVINAPEKLQGAGFAVSTATIPHPVTGTIEACARCLAECVRNKAFCSQIRPVQITPCQLDATYEHLTRDADGHELEVAVHDVDLGVGERMTDRRHNFLSRTFALGDAHGKFGRPVCVKNAAAVLPRLQHLWRACFTRHDQRLQWQPIRVR